MHKLLNKKYSSPSSSRAIHVAVVVVVVLKTQNTKGKLQRRGTTRKRLKCFFCKRKIIGEIVLHQKRLTFREYKV